jgi:hypothetical protein
MNIETQVRILLDEMFGRNFERFFISAANNAGLGETILLRANEPELIHLFLHFVQNSGAALS